jgi:small subunit ribosomal protein S6
MPVKLYETLFALDATKVSADGDAVRNAIHAHLEKFGGQIEIARPWDENAKLAYPIKKQKKAYLYIVYYRMESTKQAELERELQLDDNILRQLTMLVEPKWADTILEIARNETGSRFALKGMQEDTAPTGEGIVSNDPLVRGEVYGESEGPPPERRSRGGRSRVPAGAAEEKPE